MGSIRRPNKASIHADWHGAGGAASRQPALSLTSPSTLNHELNTSMAILNDKLH